MKNIFVSRPNWVPESFTKGLECFYNLLKASELSPRTIGQTDYPSKSPLDEVISLMHKCQGTIVLGIPQIEVEVGKIKGDSIARKIELGTEWNHIEAALAHCMGHPVLIIHHNSVQRGIFDRGASNSFLHSVDMCDPLWSICDGISGAIQNWKEELKQIPLPSKQSVESSEKPTLRWGAYKFDGMEGLYCPACYHKSNLKIPVSRLNTKFHQCPSCSAKLS